MYAVYAMYMLHICNSVITMPTRPSSQCKSTYDVAAPNNERFQVLKTARKAPLCQCTKQSHFSKLQKHH